MQIAHTEKVSLFQEVMGVEQAPMQKNCHGRGSVPCRYPQQDDKINQQHFAGCYHSPSRQLRSVDAPLSSQAQVHCQVGNLPSLRPNSDLIL